MKNPNKTYRDYYEVLQVHRRAHPDVIQAAYRALMKQNDPNHGNGEAARALNESYEILKDKNKRQTYDQSFEVDTGKVVGSYTLIEMIAEGGFGRTYKAKHNINGQLVCIKDCSNISLDHTQLLIDESIATWDLRHYAIPAIRDLIKLEDGRVLLVMSYIPGPTLQQVVEKTGRVDPENVAWIGERLLNVLSYTHRHGVVHGDVKPHNTIIQTDKHMAVLVDFGLAIVKPSSSTPSKGHTPYFAPPEEIDGMTLVPESDLYSLGMTMIYALAGDFESVAQKQVPRDVPDELCAFIKRLIAKNVTSRPNWDKEDLCDTIRTVRQKAFGRTRSGMKPIPGIS